jgi:hypothetical protein
MLAAELVGTTWVTRKPALPRVTRKPALPSRSPYSALVRFLASHLHKHHIFLEVDSSGCELTTGWQLTIAVCSPAAATALLRADVEFLNDLAVALEVALEERRSLRRRASTPGVPQLSLPGFALA